MDNYVRRAKLVSIIDGDTVRLTRDMGEGLTLSSPNSYRLYGVDTPELNVSMTRYLDMGFEYAHASACKAVEKAEAKAAKSFVEEWFRQAKKDANGDEWTITTRTYKAPDRYGRYLVEISRPGDETSLSQALIDADHAIPYYGTGDVWREAQAWTDNAAT